MLTERAPQLIGESPAWLAALEHVSRVAPLARPILVIGERGTGKELVGERLHFLSRRWDGPFVKVNCAALSEDLLDSELFGHERGAFTGATDRRVGRFELADGGTLFLDEIATASLRVQEKLLRVIEYGEFQRLGGEAVLTTDVRVVAATNVDLPGRVARGQFRADLLDRLAFDVVTLPPLRARPEDIPLLADFFARRMAVELGEDFPGWAPSAHVALAAHSWPGNVRELRNVTQRLAHRAIARGDRTPVTFEPSALDPFASPFRPGSELGGHFASGAAPTVSAPASPGVGGEASSLASNAVSLPVDFQADIALRETSLIDAALAAHRGHQGRAAEALGLTYHQFRNLLRKHGYGKGAGKPARSQSPSTGA